MLRRNHSTTNNVGDKGTSDGTRIPKTLQAVFLASNRGNDVHKPPPKQVAFKVFLRNWMGGKKKLSTKENDEAEMVEKSYPKKIKSKKRDATKPPKPVKKIDNPQEFLDRLMRSRGYCTKRYNALHTAYHNKPTPLQKASYDIHIVGIVKGGDAANLNDVLKAGISPNPCNIYGESLVHMVCRRGDQKLLQVMIQNGCDVQVADDYGRTPLHDACWAATPAFDTVEMLLARDLTLLQMTDCRGFLPLSYARKDHWPAWIEFFQSKKDVYFPNLIATTNDDETKSIISSVSTISEFVDQHPNTRPLPDPINALPLDLANMVASGAMKPEEAVRLRNKRLLKAVKPPLAIDEEKEFEGSDDDDDDNSHDDDSEYDSDDDDSDFNEGEMEELMGVLSIRLHGAESSGNGAPSVGVVSM